MSNSARKLSELDQCLRNELTEYFKYVDGHAIVGLYNMVIGEVEKSLLESVMKYVKYHQTNAALVLGMSRSTLRKKLKLYNLDQQLGSYDKSEN